ncbi:hypothetical protein BS47DRAFT_728818 [Hydnum rufescens UP504]|uniref:Uncharacterized protein n=1 Tax=Hydnum rufescens UP504 TaxID=1448309 RepID=A0A9P6DUZ9_9AGAM|nr:hypothetical protein BS47DRAFT_728818 [Hydnum rufescens UP504]
MQKKSQSWNAFRWRLAVNVGGGPTVIRPEFFFWVFSFFRSLVSELLLFTCFSRHPPAGQVLYPRGGRYDARGISSEIRTGLKDPMDSGQDTGGRRGADPKASRQIIAIQYRYNLCGQRIARYIVRALRTVSVRGVCARRVSALQNWVGSEHTNELPFVLTMHARMVQIFASGGGTQ